MQQQIDKINYRLLVILFFIFEIIYIITLNLNKQTNMKEICTHTLVFAFAYIVYMIIISKNEDKILKRSSKIHYLYIGISLSVLTIIISEFIEIYHIWMLGCLVISVIYGAYIGIISTFVMIFIDGLCNSYTPEEYIFYEALGIILCLLFEFIPDTKEKTKNLLSYFYFVIIALSCNTSLYLMTNRLNYKLLFEDRFVIIAICTAIMITIVYIIGVLTTVDKDEVGYEEGYANDKEVINYMDMLRSDYELLQKLKNNLPLIYKHSLVVADISKKAAELIKADATLTMVGGIYHEIGRIETESGDYLEHNRIIADNHNFGEILTNILMAHNVKSEKPKSKEAAIIYFTDNILNTIYYMKNVRKDNVHTNKQIIESFFNKSLKDEKFYECGLSIADYGTLRDYYVNVFEKQEG